MTRIDFYVAASVGSDARLDIAARLADKAFGRGHRVFIQTGSPDLAEELDDYLWSFRPASFLPHALASEKPDADVVIGWAQDPAPHDDVLINLAPTAPAFFSRFERVAEVVTQDPESLDQLRAAWRFYRDRGYPLNKHDL